MSLKFSMNKHTFENKNMMKELELSDTESDVESDVETVDESGEDSLEDGVIESKGETNDDSNAEFVSESVSESETDSDGSETQNIYDLDYIKNVKEYGFQFTLPEKTLGLINRISRMVGAPSYIKTPIFHRSKHSNPNYKNRDFKKRNSNRKKRNPKPLDDDEWDSIRSFEETKMKKIREGIDNDIALITKHLNKLTDDTFDLCYEEVCDILDRLVDVANTEDILIVCKNIFEISSSNGFYSKVFAKLLANTINKYEQMKQVFSENTKDFLKYFQEFEYANADEDYDKFCDVNLRNEKRRAYAKCVANLVNEGIISVDIIIKNISIMIHNFKMTIDQEKKNFVSEQIIEIIFIMVNESYDTIKDHEDYDSFVKEDIVEISNMKRKDYNSLPSKCIFRAMELVDKMEADEQ